VHDMLPTVLFAAPIFFLAGFVKGVIGLGLPTVAIGLLVPLAFLFRYSLNQFVPGKFMVDALTIENYVKFFTDIYYTAVLTRTVRVALAGAGAPIMWLPLLLRQRARRRGHGSTTR